MIRSKANRIRNFKMVNPAIADTFDFNDTFEFDFSTIDISSAFENLFSYSNSKLFLGRFSEADMRGKMESLGLAKHLDSIGFTNTVIDIEQDENYINYFKLYWEEKLPEKLLIDLRVSEHTFFPKKRFFEEGVRVDPFNMILIEWLSAKNPKAAFDHKRPQLPGQSSPGLGVLKYCFRLLHDISDEIFKDGFLDIPTHMHGAMMYSKEFKFFDPVQEAILRALIRDLGQYSLADISWGMLTETIIDQYKDTPVAYDPGEQIHYVSSRMKKYFESELYVSKFNKHYNRRNYYFKYDEMVRKREEILKTKKIEDL